jgi:phosphoserine phosphatase
MASLASWNDGATKSAIVDFVARVTKEGGAGYVPPDARIAVFDNDGTLWCEKPMPVQTGFLMEKLVAAVKKDPSLRAKQPWKAVVEKDEAWLSGVITKHYNGDDSDLKVLAGGLLASAAGDSVETVAQKAEAFLRGGRNDKLSRPYLKTAYAPMRELLDYLAAHGFTNYIVSGGGRDFMRPITRELYGIPPERVVGTSVALEYREENGVVGLYQTPKLEIFDDGPTKVVRIWSRIGARPIFAAGNSNGDVPMLKFATQGTPKGMAILVDHDDGEREIAYKAGAEKSVDEAKRSSWTIVSVKRDWKQVFVD